MVQETFSQFIAESRKSVYGATGELTSLLQDIATSCKHIAMYVHKGPKLGVLGDAISQNVQGETQKTLDVISNDIFIKHNQWRGHIAGIVSEELDQVYQIPEQYHKGKYLVCVDPLDGSSNINVNVSVGTIFSILKRPLEEENVSDQSFLQPAKDQIAAGYCLYGPQTTLVVTTGQGVNGFVLDLDVGEFMLAYPNMTIPEDTSEYAINSSNRRYWDKPIKRYIEECEAGLEGPRNKDFNTRWVASMVADVHRILTRGGLFMYPLDNKLRAKGMTGRLRLLYEINPLSFIIEQAGGAAIRESDNVRDYIPKSIHERGPIIMGSKNEVERIQKYYLI